MGAQLGVLCRPLLRASKLRAGVCDLVQHAPGAVVDRDANTHEHALDNALRLDDNFDAPVYLHDVVHRG